MDAFNEFLTENAQRAYPLLENASGGLPNDVLLDARGFSRMRPDIAPQLVSIVATDLGATSGTTLEFQFGCVTNGAAPIFSFFVPAANVQWPLVLSANIPDQEYPGAFLGSLRICVGSGIFRLAEPFLPAVPVPLEPALVALLYRTQVDSIRLVHQSGGSDFVGGNLLVHGGYNLSVTNLNGSLFLSAVPGGGELGAFVGSVNPESACLGALLSVCGSRADSQGRFSILPGKGISVTNLPLQNKIQIQANPSAMGGTALCAT